MVREFEEYARSTTERLGATGIEAKIWSAEISPNVYKLCIALITKETLASFTAWEKGSELPVAVDIEALGVLDGKLTVSKTIEPKESQELIEAFDELTKYLTLRHHN